MCDHDYIPIDSLKEGWIIKKCWKCGKKKMKEVSEDDYTTESD